MLSVLEKLLNRLNRAWSRRELTVHHWLWTHTHFKPVANENIDTFQQRALEDPDVSFEDDDQQTREQIETQRQHSSMLVALSSNFMKYDFETREYGVQSSFGQIVKNRRPHYALGWYDTRVKAPWWGDRRIL